MSLGNPAIAAMEADPTQACNQDDAPGFLRLNGLRRKVAAQVQGNVGAASFCDWHPPAGPVV